MKNKFFLALTCAIFLILSGCSSQKKIAGNYTYKTECLGIELDGSQTVKAWGNGRNRFDAIEQAKKNAVRDVLFNGIIEGKSDCEKRPVVPEVNAQLKYETYFNKFLADGGEYKNYVSMKDEQLGQKGTRDQKGARESVTLGLVIRVLRLELKQKMIADGILK
jgi:uncharacterized protein YceK